MVIIYFEINNNNNIIERIVYMLRTIYFIPYCILTFNRK